MNKIQQKIKGFKIGKWVWWLLAGVVLLLLIKPIKSLFTTLSDSVSGVTGALGLTDSTGLQQAKNDVSASAWGVQLAKQNPNSVTLTPARLAALAQSIYDDWGFFSKDFDNTLASFKQCQNQTDVSALCAVFLDKYNKDLLAYISPLTWTFDFRNYPTSDQYTIIHNFVTKLPQH